MTALKKIILMSLGLTAISQSVYANYWDNDNLLSEKTLSLQADTLQAILMDTGAGDMKIVGDTNTDTIKVSASIFGQELDEDEYQLSLEKKGDQAVLYAHITQEHHNNERIDLKISLPATLKLEVRDRSGDIQIESMQGGVSINDSSGDIDLSNITGGLEIDDTSGDISANTVVGDITINDRSGDINLITVEGDTIIHDRSGDIRANTLSGNLDIEDSSGDIRVKTVSGVVTVEDSSGSIYVNGAQDFVLVADGSGDVDLDNILSRSERVLK
ncbi:MAG: hypothetical protein ACI88A_004637 [Paraglaciecola sp.]|jgi:hypothetical protein